jgi:hypothetical protein
LLCSRWLHAGDAELTPEQRLALSRDIANASDRADRAVRSLGLPNKAKMTIWETLHTRAADAPQAAPLQPSATADGNAVPDAGDAPESKPDAGSDPSATPATDAGDLEKKVHVAEPPEDKV